MLNNEREKRDRKTQVGEGSVNAWTCREDSGNSDLDLVRRALDISGSDTIGPKNTREKCPTNESFRRPSQNFSSCAINPERTHDNAISANTESGFQKSTSLTNKSAALSDPEASRSYKARSNTGEEGRRSPGRLRCRSYLALLLDKAFLLHCASLFLSSIHISGVFLHLPEFAQQSGTTHSQSAMLFLAVGTTSLVSKLSCGFAISDRRVEPLILSVGMMGLNGIITCLFPLFSDSYLKQMVFSALFGLYFGGLYALVIPILVLFVDVERLPDAYGVSMFFLGTGYFVGPPLAAMIVDAGGTYGHSFLFLGMTTLVAAFLEMTAASFLKPRDNIHDVID